MILTPARVNQVVASSHEVTSRVEVWSRGELIERDAPHVGGTETDQWVSGSRRNISLVVPTREWLAWFDLPKLEVKVYAGLIAGESSYETPRGVFVVDTPPISRAISTTIQAKDRWVMIEDDDFPGQIPAYKGRISQVCARIISESTGRAVSNTVTSQANQLGMDIFDKARKDVCLELLDSVSAEAYFDENGVAHIRDRQAENSTIVLKDGEQGTVIASSRETGWATAYNTWAVSSSNPDVTFRTVVVTLPAAHPASTANRRKKVRRYSSPLFANRNQAIAAANTLMAKESMPTLTYTIACAPNPLLRAGHRVQVQTEIGSATCVVSKVDTPIGRGTQTVTASVE